MPSFFGRIVEDLSIPGSSCAGLHLLLTELVRHCLYLVHVLIHASALRREHRLHGLRPELGLTQGCVIRVSLAIRMRITVRVGGSDDAEM